MSDQGRLLTANDAEPPVGSRVRALGQVWVHWPEGYWMAEDGDEPESWMKVAGNFGPAELLMSKQKAIEEAVAELNALDGGDQESDHGMADEILLQFVPEEVRAAWKAACDRVGFWYA